jgi:penicillin-binding protein 1A
MRRAGFISAEEEGSASTAMQGIVRARRQTAADGSGYAVVLEELPPFALADGAEIIVETTLDRELQQRTARIVAQNIDARGGALQASQAAVVVVDDEGGVRALVGGRSYAESQFNRAAKAQRQPGSAFKPFVYLAALEDGLTADSIVEDLPMSVGGWAPRNDNGEYQGAMALRTALSRSVNTVAVRLALQVGPARVAAAARRLGIRSALGRDASLALGTSEVSLLELTGAYNVLANGGRTAEPYVLARILTRSGRILYSRNSLPGKQVVAPAHVGAMNEMLNAALVSGTGRRAALPWHPAAGKTGTSQRFRDAWFVGYTAHLTTGVWIGNDDGRAMKRVVGGGLPADIWREVMLAAHEGMEPRPLAGTAIVAAPQASHPREPIDGDLIARALQEGPMAIDDAGASPAGMMSLGRESGD